MCECMCVRSILACQHARDILFFFSFTHKHAEVGGGETVRDILRVTKEVMEVYRDEQRVMGDIHFN